MKTIEEVNKYLIENRTDENGDVDLRGLVFPENVYFDGMKVKGNLAQNFQTVGNDLSQGRQNVGGDLCQDYQTAKRMIFQSHDGLEEGKDGYWRKDKTLAEKVADSDLDEDLKKEILANLKGGGK